MYVSQKKLLFGELQQGKRSQGGQKKRFKDTLKASLKAFSISHTSWKQLARYRQGWRSAIRNGTTAYEASRILTLTLTAEERRVAIKSRAENPLAASIQCPHCSRVFRAQIGLLSHLRTHKPPKPRPQNKRMKKGKRHDGLRRHDGRTHTHTHTCTKTSNTGTPNG